MNTLKLGEFSIDGTSFVGYNTVTVNITDSNILDISTFNNTTFTNIDSTKIVDINIDYLYQLSTTFNTIDNSISYNIVTDDRLSGLISSGLADNYKNLNSLIISKDIYNNIIFNNTETLSHSAATLNDKYTIDCLLSNVAGKRVSNRFITDYISGVYTYPTINIVPSTYQHVYGQKFNIINTIVDDYAIYYNINYDQNLLDNTTYPIIKYELYGTSSNIINYTDSDVTFYTTHDTTTIDSTTLTVAHSLHNLQLSQPILNMVGNFLTCTFLYNNIGNNIIYTQVNDNVDYTNYNNLIELKPSTFQYDRSLYLPSSNSNNIITTFVGAIYKPFNTGLGLSQYNFYATGTYAVNFTKNTVFSYVSYTSKLIDYNICTDYINTNNVTYTDGTALLRLMTCPTFDKDVDNIVNWCLPSPTIDQLIFEDKNIEYIITPTIVYTQEYNMGIIFPAGTNINGNVEVDIYYRISGNSYHDSSLQHVKTNRPIDFRLTNFLPLSYYVIEAFATIDDSSTIVSSVINTINIKTGNFTDSTETGMQFYEDGYYKITPPANYDSIQVFNYTNCTIKVNAVNGIAITNNYYNHKLFATDIDVRFECVDYNTINVSYRFFNSNTWELSNIFDTNIDYPLYTLKPPLSIGGISVNTSGYDICPYGGNIAPLSSNVPFKHNLPRNYYDIKYDTKYKYHNNLISMRPVYTNYQYLYSGILTAKTVHAPLQTSIYISKDDNNSVYNVGYVGGQQITDTFYYQTNYKKYDNVKQSVYNWKVLTNGSVVSTSNTEYFDTVNNAKSIATGVADGYYEQCIMITDDDIITIPMFNSGQTTILSNLNDTTTLVDTTIDFSELQISHLSTLTNIKTINHFHGSGLIFATTYCGELKLLCSNHYLKYCAPSGVLINTVINFLLTIISHEYKLLCYYKDGYNKLTFIGITTTNDIIKYYNYNPIIIFTDHNNLPPTSDVIENCTSINIDEYGQYAIFISDAKYYTYSITSVVTLPPDESKKYNNFGIAASGIKYINLENYMTKNDGCTTNCKTKSRESFIYSNGTIGFQPTDTNRDKSPLLFGYNNLHTTFLTDLQTYHIFAQNYQVGGAGTNNYGQLTAVNSLTNVIALTGSDNHIVGLTMDGAVVAAGDNTFGQCNVSGLTDIVQIVATINATFGLKANGTVVLCGFSDSTYEYGRVAKWGNVTRLRISNNNIFGTVKDSMFIVMAGNMNRFADIVKCRNFNDVHELKETTCVTYHDAKIYTELLHFGDNTYNQSGLVSTINDFEIYNVYVSKNMTIIKDIYNYHHVSGKNSDLLDSTIYTSLRYEWLHGGIHSGSNHIVANKVINDKVVAIGDNTFGQCDTTGLSDVTSIDCGDNHTIGLTTTNHVVSCGNNADGQCDTTSWNNVIKISCGGNRTIGLLSNGHVVACGDNTCGQCDTTSYINITDIKCGLNHTVLLDYDNTTHAIGDNTFGQCNVTDLTDIQEIYTCDNITIGLKLNGDYVACGDNSLGLCDVNNYIDMYTLLTGSNHIIGMKYKGSLVNDSYPKIINGT